jgi:predicted phage terminase large subunit-like protein
VRDELSRREAIRQRQQVNDNADAIRARCRTLAGFVREAWHVLEPNAVYVHNWHIDAICDHLTSVSHGYITRLLINVPPGSMKSLLVSVFWPAWEWGPKGMRSMRYLVTAHNDKPVLRDGERSLRLLQSEWYQSLWPEVQLTSTAVTAFGNSATGIRRGVAFGSLMGMRGDRLILDDPHSVDTAESEVERATTARRFREGALDRLNDKQRSAIVVIMQRLHENDIAGVILAQKMDYVYLMLPMEFEPERACETIIGFKDPRTYDGELLDPERVPRHVLEQLKNDTTAYAFAGQYQQRPAPREGNMFKYSWFADKFVNNAPTNCRWVRHWDLAGTKKNSAARSAGVKIGRAPDGRFYVANVIKVQEEGAAVRKIILATAQAERHVEISLPQDPGQSGKVQAQDYVAMLAGFLVSAQPETGDKCDRARPFADQCEIGNVFIVKSDWNESYLDELCSFPTAKFKDQVDASSGAFGRLAQSIQTPLRFGSYGR